MNENNYGTISGVAQSIMGGVVLHEDNIQKIIDNINDRTQKTLTGIESKVCIAPKKRKQSYHHWTAKENKTLIKNGTLPKGTSPEAGYRHLYFLGGPTWSKADDKAVMRGVCPEKRTQSNCIARRGFLRQSARRKQMRKMK